MKQPRAWLWIRLGAALVIEFVFLAVILPECVRDSTYGAEVWKDFGVASGAVLVIYTIWPALRWGSLWIRLSGFVLCLIPVWVLGWVVMQHFDFVPRWFS